MINTFKTKNTLVGFTVKLIYQITVHHSDESLLRAIKAFFQGVVILSLLPISSTYHIEYINYLILLK